MTLREDQKIGELLLEGHALLGQGRGSEAALAFGRVLLQDPSHGEARRGMDAAREAVVEAERRLEEESTRDEAAPTHVPGVSSAEGIVPAPESTPTPAPARRRQRAFAGGSRAAFGTVCVLFFVLLGAAVSSTWDTLLHRLARTPAPRSTAVTPATSLPATTSAERSLAEARRLLDAGQPAAALSALDRVGRSEPEYPFASHLRSHAERMMGGHGAAPSSAARSAP